MIVAREIQATSRGAALLALDALGRRPLASDSDAPLSAALAPDPARHARYRAALDRQRGLDERV